MNHGGSPRLLRRADRPAKAFALIARILAAVPAGFGVVSLLVAVLGGTFAALGMGRSEAVTLATMVGFLLYLGWLLWAFAVHSVVRLYATAWMGAAACGLALRWLPGP